MWLTHRVCCTFLVLLLAAAAAAAAEARVVACPSPSPSPVVIAGGPVSGGSRLRQVRERWRQMCASACGVSLPDGILAGCADHRHCIT